MPPNCSFLQQTGAPGMPGCLAAHGHSKGTGSTQGTGAMSQPKNEAKEGKGVPEKPVVTISIDAVPKGELKDLGGGNRDQWNDRISRLVLKALPVDLKNA